MFFSKGKKIRFDAASNPAPSANALELLDLGRVFKKVNKLAADIDVQQPGIHPQATKWDGETLESWMRKNVLTRLTKNYLRLIAEIVYSAEAADFSFLHFLFYTKANESLEALISVEGAQQKRVKGGTQQISERLAALLADKVHFGYPVDKISQSGTEVTISSGPQHWSAKKVIVAIPPTLAGRIQYTPPLSANRDQLTQRIPMGSVIKVQVVYEKPFWREVGLKGQVLSFDGLIKTTFDNSPLGADYGVLVGFMGGNDGRQASKWSLEERRAQTIALFTDYFGAQAKDYKAYYERDWSAAPYARGGYGGHFPTGVWTAYGKYLRAPAGHIHWASAETATEWNGYMEGAVRSGERAAEEVLTQLSR